MPPLDGGFPFGSLLLAMKLSTRFDMAGETSFFGKVASLVERCAFTWELGAELLYWWLWFYSRYLLAD